MSDDALPAVPAPEFSRPISVLKLGSKLARYTITADPAECAALATRFDLVSVEKLSAIIDLRYQPGEGVRLTAELDARIVQSCTVTLEPVPAQIVEHFTLIFKPGIDEDEADRLALENPEDEIIEPLIGDSIDIGEAVAQQLSVAIDPYPRAPSVDSAFAEAESGDVPDVSDGDGAPFSALAALKKPV